MLKAFDFHVGDKIRLTKKYDNESPYETWETSAGCPPLEPGTTGKVTAVKSNHIGVSVTNPRTGKPAYILIYDVDVKMNLKHNRLDCVEIAEKPAAIAA